MQASRAFVVLLVLSAVSLTLGDYCMPITNTANSVCGTLPAATCTPTATSVDGSTYSAANYGTLVNNWNAQKSNICPNNPRLVDDYPLQRFCPDLCTSNYTCQANAYTNANSAPMCYHLCVQCFDVATCTAWSQTPGNVTRPGQSATGCYGSWTHMGADTLQVNDVTPTWGYIKGNQRVVITGCGFTTYSEATCVWGNWHSTTAFILDDNTIHCWTPKVSFVTIPTSTSFQIIFDGTPAISRKLPDFWWGPMITTISPTQVYVAGGTTLNINGFGFSEWTAATTNVTIDGAACTGVSITDTSIACTIPAGSINQNAIVDVYFNGNKYYFAHTYPNTLHYGPILNSINPTCGHVKGGDVITLSGTLFDDPILNNPRVEFFINGGWWYGTNAQHVGSTITVQTPLPAYNYDAWNNDVPVVVYGGSPSNAKVPGTASFHYGALLFTVTPTVGYIDGGETVSITGCAFRDYTNANVTGVFLNTASNNLCNLNTVNIVSDNLMTCTSLATTTCFQNQAVNVAFADGKQIPTNTQTNVQNNWWYGPKLTVTSLTPSRGPINFLNPVTVTGYKIGRSANTLFSTNQATFTSPAVTVNATVAAGQTTMAFSAPTYIWQGVSTVSYNWETCGTYPDLTPQYKWGPSCSGLTPTFGYLGGNQQVTLNGIGFQDQDWNQKTLRARFCTPSAGCNWEQLGSTNVTVTSPSTATVATPGFALAPRNGFGANRYFGDVATVTLFFDTNGVNETQQLSCGNYRYGPIVTGLNPRKGPIGPRADHSPNTAVTVQGVGFADPLLTNNIRVAFGNIHGESATTVSDTAISVKTLWGARANTDKSVYVYFDTCNTTVSTSTFTWGPQVFNVTPIWGYNAGTNGTNNQITIKGAQFLEWRYNGFTDAVCVIDNVYGTNTAIVDDNTITCTVPARPFGTQAVVQVVFGKTCRGEWDWSQVAQSPVDIYYKPLITGITPTYGYTSGNQQVTISGYGLGNWPQYYCFFGHYQGTVVSDPAGALDGSVVCSTPSRREDFNSDVLVHVQLVADTTLQSAGFDFKVWGPTYHYGPICTSVTPSRGYFNHDASYQITLNGDGFDDPTWFNVTQPYVLVDGQNVTVNSASKTTIIISNLTNANSCQQNRTITMWWDKQTQTISCPVYTHGPVVTQSTPDLGWAGDSVTIFGDFLDDPVLYNQLTNVQVNFGSAAATVVSVSQQQITVNAPVNAWLFDAPVTVAWSGYNKTCSALKATNFHYGPIITSIVPTFGYVSGNTPVTINGRGFQCCGLQTGGVTNCRFAHTEVSGGSTVNGDTSVTCNSLWRANEITSSATATTTKAVGLSFNSTARIIDTDTNAGGRQSLVTYYYGPIVTAVTPTFGRIRGGTPIVISGGGFDDPYFTNPTFGPLEPVVRFTQTTGGNGVWNINATSHAWGTVSVTTGDYLHKCGDNDAIALVFYTNSSTTDRFIIPTNNTLTHHYGPLVTNVDKTWGYVKGGDSVTITATELDEWTGRKVRVLFGNRESNNADTEFTVASGQSSYTVLTPRGSFLHSGPVSLILDYKNDALTTAAYWWHWHPYTSSVSQAWGLEGGGFQTTVYGGGFCEYELVTCSFGSAGGSQSDVAYDDRVVCHVPEAAPGTSTISLTFCDYWADCQASYAGSADNVAAMGFTHVGITSVAPSSGPWVGNTLVTITGSGFDQFTAISIAFGSLTATPVGNSTASQILVYTPAAPAAQTVQIFLTLTYTFSDGQTQQVTIPDRSSTPFNFRYDYPAITDIAPATTDVDVTVPVTLTGVYFNGGVLGNIKCFWNVPTKTGVTTLTVAPTAKTDTTVTCSAPNVVNGVVLLGGATVQVSWDGTRKSNIVGFGYTQNPAVTGITPTQGPQYGATRVTVFGNNFNTGISVLCKFSDQVAASVDITYSSTTTTTTTTTGAANTTTSTTAASTTGAANTTTTTTGAANTTANGTAPVAARYGGREVRGTADAIVCLSPRSLSNSFPATAKVEVSLDGGVTWTTTTTGVNSFTYQEGFTSTSESATVNSTSNTNALVPLISMVFALVIFVVVF